VRELCSAAARCAVNIENCKVTFSSGTSVYASGSAGAAVGSINTSSSASISGVQVSADEGIALSVTSSSGSAGGVVGSVKASSFELSDTYAVGGGDYDSISGAVHAGGLAGTVEVSTLNVDLSYASSYIKAGSGAAGGLVGYMSVTSSGSIIDTYVGGRTKYDAGSAEGTAASSYYDAVTTDGSQGRYNVISGGASYGAGGFIGVIASGSSVSVTDSYTTASAYSSAGGSAGGFIGTAASTSASINYCYSTGLVGSTTVSKAGCFIGLDSGVSATGNYYLSGINKSVTAASGTASAKNSSATAAGTGTSGSPFAGTSTVDSSTYNTMLSSLSYTFTSAAGLTHVGDWPIAGGGANIKVSVYWADRYYDSNGSSTDTFYDQKWKTSDYMSVTAQLWSYTSGSTEGTLVDSITFPTEEGKWDSGETWYDLPETDSEGNALSYVVRELYAVEYKDENKFYLNDTTGTIAEKNYLVYYTTQADPDEEDTTLWTIANVREYVNIYGELKWIDLDDSKRPEEVVLYVVRDNGVKVAYVANTRTILFAEDHVFRKDGLWPDNTDPDPSSYSRDLTYDGNTVENWSYDNTNGEWEFDFGYFQMRQSSDNYLYEYTVRQNPILVDGNQWYTTYANPYDDNVYHIEIENDVCFYVFYMTGATIEDSVIMTQEYKLTKNENSNATTYTATVISTKGVEYDVQVDGMNIVGWVEIEHVDDDDATVYAYNMNYQTRSSNSEEYYVDHDMTLVPVYAYSCTITYETCIPDVYVDAQVYAKGATTEAPEDPVYTDDYIFEGWYTSNDENADDYELYTFGQAINEDITLYAKWTTDKYASYTVIVWQQSASDWSPMMNSTLYKATGKYAQEENTYELYSYNYYDGDDETLDSNHRVRPFSSVQSLMDSVLISGQKEYSGLSIQGLYYASCDKNSVYFKSDGSTIINVYYDRYKFNIVFNGYYDSDSNLQTLFKDAGLVNGTTGKLTELKYVSNDKLSYADKRYESVTLKRDDDTFYGTISKESKTETQSVWVSGYWNYYEDNNGSYVYSDRLGQYRDRRRDDRGPYYSRTWVGGHYEDQEVETITYYFNATDGNKYVISKDDYGWAYYNKGGAQCNIYDSREEQVYYSQISYSYYNLDECITYSMTVHYTVTGTEYYFEYDSDGDGEITDDEKYYVSSYDGRIYSEDFSTYLYYYYNYKYNTIDYSYIRGYKGYTLYIYVTDPNASYKITFEGTEYDVKKTSDGYAYVTIGDTDYMLLSSMNNTSASYIRYAKLDQYKNSTIYYCYEYEVDLSYTTYYGLYGQALSTYEYKGKMLYPWPDSIAWNYTGSSTGLSFLGAFLSEEADLDTTSKTYTLSLTKNGTPGSQIYVYFCKQDINGNGTYTDSRDNSVTYNISNFAGYNSDWGINFSLSEKYEGYSLYSYSFDGVNWYEADTSVTVSLSRNGHNKLYIGFRCNTYEFSFVTGLNGDGEKNFTTDIFYGDTFSQYKGFPIMIGGSEITEYAADNGYTAKPHTSTDGWYLNTAGTIKASQIEEIYFPGSTLQSATQYVKGNEVLITELKIKDSSGNVTTEYIDASGKLFLGWYKDPAGAKEFDFDAIMPSANIVVYGVWQMPKVTISFASAPAYEGDTFTLNIDVYEDQVITVNSTNELRKPNTNPVRDDYRFMGWYVLNDDGEYVTAGFANPYTEDTTIYACWRSLESGYTMTYVVGGSTTVVVDTTTYMNGASARIKNYLPDDETIAEYGEFIGWNTKEDGTGEAYYPGLTYTFSNSNVTLYAQFAQED